MHPYIIMYIHILNNLNIINLPTTVRFTLELRVWANLKSTRHRYKWTASFKLTRSIRNSEEKYVDMMDFFWLLVFDLKSRSLESPLTWKCARSPNTRWSDHLSAPVVIKWYEVESYSWCVCLAVDLASTLLNNYHVI